MCLFNEGLTLNYDLAIILNLIWYIWMSGIIAKQPDPTHTHTSVTLPILQYSKVGEHYPNNVCESAFVSNIFILPMNHSSGQEIGYVPMIRLFNTHCAQQKQKCQHLVRDDIDSLSSA